jgi:hypothetical protein
VLAPVLQSLFVALANGEPVLIGIVVLCASLLVIHLKLMERAGRWLAPAVLGGAAAALALAAIATAGFDARRPRSNRLLYVANSDQASASWATSDEATDAWTSAVMGARPGRRPSAELLPNWYGRHTFRRDAVLAAPAATFALDGPRVELAGRTQAGERERRRYRIQSPRGAAVTAVRIKSDEDLANVRLMDGAGASGQALVDRREISLFTYALPPAGALIEFEAKVGQKVEFEIVDASYDLPAAAAIEPRPEAFVPVRSRGDGTVLWRRYQFD